MLEHSLEWLFRLAIEPRRLFARYVVGNPLFLYRVLRERITGR
jgi:UDP-N-acetyl-D-mannosaminuronic acid transferase (WecB/TagA/CpsF family)